MNGRPDTGRPATSTIPMLKGVRVIDFSALLPGAIATQILADFGADVIKVERPGGDPLRQMMPGFAEAVGRGKRSIVLDLKQAADRETAHALCADAAVVIEGFRPGVAGRLQIDHKTLSAHNPDLVYCSLSGYGQTGSRRLDPGHDLNFGSLAGEFATQTSPTVPLLPVGDTLGGTYAAAAVLASLNGGGGAYIDLSITEAVLAAMAPLVNEHVARGHPSPADFPSRPAYGLFTAADRRVLCIGCTEDHFWNRICAVLELDELGSDQGLTTWEGRAQRADEIETAIGKAVGRRTHAELVDAFRRADVPITEVSEFRDVLRERQFVERSALVPETDGGFVQVGFPALIDGVRPLADGPLPAPDGDGNGLRNELMRRTT